MKHFLIVLLLFPSVLLGAPSSNPYIPISPIPATNSAPLLAVAINGNAFVAWLHFPNSVQVAYFRANNAASAAPNFGTWSFLGTISNAVVPSIGIDSFGNSFIVWKDFITAQILVSKFSSTTLNFTVPVQLSIATDNFNPKIAVNGNGVALVIWQTPTQVLSSSYNPETGLWSAATPILFTIVPTSPNGTDIVLAPVVPADFALDNFNRGIAIINHFSSIGVIGQTTIQAARLFVP